MRYEHKTQRRTKAEIQLVNQLDELAQQTAQKPLDPEKIARAKKLTAAAKKSPRYEYNRGYSTIDQLPIMYFYAKGESVTGVLGEHHPEQRMACTYPIRLDDGRGVRIFAHRRLRQLVETGGYIGRKVTITYQGKLFTWGSHYEKLYDIDVIDEEAEKQQALLEAAKNADSHKVLEAAAAGGNEFAAKMLKRKARKEGK